MLILLCLLVLEMNHPVTLQVTAEVINLPITEVDCVFTVGSMSVMERAQVIDNSVICPITTGTNSLFTSGGKNLL